MTQRLGLALYLASLACSSYSEPFTYGASANAATNGLKWNMADVFPSATGLDVNGLIYRYTTVKNTADAMKVHVGNLKGQGEGYIFRETDDWSGLPGNTITKSFVLPNIPSASWGNGSIEVEGFGSVKNPVVIYNYRLDECYDPQLNPACSGYVKPVPEIVKIEIYDALDDDAVSTALDSDTNFKYDQDGNRIFDEDDEEQASRLELGLTASANALTMFKSQGQDDIINQINKQTSIAMYYNSSLNGGVYQDNTSLADGYLPDNPRALRNNLAQQLLHEQMVQQQYGE